MTADISELLLVNSYSVSTSISNLCVNTERANDILQGDQVEIVIVNYQDHLFT